MSSEADDETGAGVELAFKSDVGQVRSANEDSCDIFERADGTRLLVVADGMGGHQGGATASQTALSTISEVFDSDTSNDTEDMLRRAIERANASVYEMAQSNPELEGMGTTVVAFSLSEDHRATVAHVGDSRAYRYRQGHLEPLTVDHSVVAEMHRRGLISADEAATHPRRNEILRSVGVLPEVEVEIAKVAISPGDRFVLCSDGLSGVLDDAEIAAVVQAESPESAVETLVRMANERGGPDNITVQVLAIPAGDGEGDPEATAPVELSEVGIRAIEKKRLGRQRIRRGVAIVVVAVLATGLYFLWRLIAGQPPIQPNPAKATPTRDMPADSTLERPSTHAPDGLGSEQDSPRRGIPR